MSKAAPPYATTWPVEAGLQAPAALSALIAYQLRLAQEASFQAVREGAGGSLKPGWYTILTILSDNPGLTPTNLSKLCGRDRSTLTSTLKVLSAQGLIEGRRKPGDGRSYGVKLTVAGQGMLKKLQVVARAHDARLDAIVGKDKPMLMSLLRRIVSALSVSEAQAIRSKTVGGTGARHDVRARPPRENVRKKATKQGASLKSGRS